MDDQTKLEIFLEALEKIISNAPDEKPEEEDYDDTESAYWNGGSVAWYEAATIARNAIKAIQHS